MKCPECNTELIQGKPKKQEDGTEYFELKCLNCKARFMDMKIPKSVFGLKLEDTTAEREEDD